MKRVFNLKNVFGLTCLAILIALGVVLSAFLQFRLFSDIKIDLSYIVIVVICYFYGGVIGGLSAGGIAALESALFTSYGFSPSWMCANIVVGLITGLVLKHNPIKNKVVKHSVNIIAITLSVAIGMLLVKTIIECNLYSIPFEVKIVKNAVAFGADLTCMVIGYFALLPVVIKINKPVEEEEVDEEI